MDESSPSSPDQLVLTEFQASVERCVGMLSGRLKHCGRSAFRHLRRSWLLKSSMPELAAFSMVTAEEEACTAIILALKARGYPGAQKLNHRSHSHKLSIVPFLKSAAEVFAHMNVASPTISISEDESEQTFKLLLRLDARKLGIGDDERPYLYPDPPLNFAISDQNGPMDFGRVFSEFVSGKGYNDVLKYISDESNLRNRLLYAADGGIAHVEFPERFFLLRTDRVVNLFVILLMIVQTSEEQLIISQFLDALLRIHQKLKISQFSYSNDGEGRQIQVKWEGDAPPIVTHVIRKNVRFRYYWQPHWFASPVIVRPCPFWRRRERKFVSVPSRQN